MGQAPARKLLTYPTLFAIGVKGFHPSVLLVVFYRPEDATEEADLKENLFTRSLVESLIFTGWSTALDEQTLEFAAHVSTVGPVHIFDLAPEAAELPLEVMGNNATVGLLKGFTEIISNIHGITGPEGDVLPLPWIMASAIRMIRPATK